MTAESNVGLRILVIGKDAALAGVRELTAATARMNAEIAAGGASSKVAAAGMAEEGTALDAMGVKMDLYRKNLAGVNAETAAVGTLGKRALFTLGAAFAVASVESIRWATQYQAALTLLRTQAGLTVTAMNAIGKAAMANSAGLGISPTSYLQAAYHPASTGMGVAQSIAITNYGAKLAAIGGTGTSVEDTTNALTGVMKSYGMNASQTGKTAAMLNAIVGAGNMHYSDLNSALASGVAATGKTFGVNLNSVGGALEFMTDRGVPAAQAGTHLRMTLALLGAPSHLADKLLTDAGMGSTTAANASNAMSQTLQAAGVTSTQLSSALRNNSGGGGIYNALNLLHQHLSGLSPEMQAAMISRSFGGGRMGTTVEMMYNNIAGLGQKTGQIDRNSTSSRFNSDWATTTKTMTFQLHALDAEVHTLGISFGTALLPPLTKVVGAFTDLLKFFGKNKDAAMALGGVVTAVLAPAMGLYLFGALKRLTGPLRMLIRGFGTLVGGQTAEQIAAARTDAALGAEDASLVGNDTGLAVNDRALLTNAADRAASGGGGLPVGRSPMGGASGLTSALTKLGLGGLAATIAMPLINQATQKKLIHLVGRQAQGVMGDAAAGAMAGMFLGPEGAALGAGIGALYGDRTHLLHNLKNVGEAEHRGVHNAVHGLDIVRHEGAHLWDDVFGGGHASTTPNTRPITVRVDNHLYIDGKEVTKVVQKNIKATASRN